jgi:hypothetical protein
MREFTKRLRRSWRDFRRPDPSLSLDMFPDSGYFLDVFGFFVPLPFLDRHVYEPRNGMMASWGVAYFDRSIMLKWGNWSKFIHMPWSYDHVDSEHKVMRPDGTWVLEVPTWDESKEPDGRWQETYPYTYVLRNGQVQERLATICVVRRQWRQKWLWWTSWFAMKQQTIDVCFNDEVGERSGSWKGGCIGCGYDMKPGETPLDTLRRMERERVFD